MHFHLVNVIINHKLVGESLIVLQQESGVGVGLVGEEDVVGAGDESGEDEGREDQGGGGEPGLPVSGERPADRHVPLHCEGHRHVH